MIEKIVLSNNIELTIEEARELYQELRQLFEVQQPITIPQPQQVPQRWDGAPIVTCKGHAKGLKGEAILNDGLTVVRPTEMWFPVADHAGSPR